MQRFLETIQVFFCKNEVFTQLMNLKELAALLKYSIFHDMYNNKVVRNNATNAPEQIF